MKRSTPRLRMACEQPWEEMESRGAHRYCEACELTVHDGLAMTRAELDALMAGGTRVCLRLVQLPDGTPITADHPRAPRSLRATGKRVLAPLLMASTTAFAPGACDVTPPVAATQAATTEEPCDTEPGDDAELSPEEYEQLVFLGAYI